MFPSDGYKTRATKIRKALETMIRGGAPPAYEVVWDEDQIPVGPGVKVVRLRWEDDQPADRPTHPAA